MPEAVAALEERERCLDQIHALEAELLAKHADLTGGSKVGISKGGYIYFAQYFKTCVLCQEDLAGWRKQLS